MKCLHQKSTSIGIQEAPHMQFDLHLHNCCICGTTFVKERIMRKNQSSPGRPPKKPSERKSERVSVRCTPGTKKLIQGKYGSMQAFFDWATQALIL